MYSAFCERHRKWVMSHKTAMRIAHKPAEQMQVDDVGDTMEVVDMDTGEVLKVYVFAACLPFSGKLYAKGSYDMREESWVDAHVSALPSSAAPRRSSFRTTSSREWRSTPSTSS